MEKQSKIPQSMLWTEIAKENKKVIIEIHEILNLFNKADQKEQERESKMKEVLKKISPTIDSRYRLVTMRIKAPDNIKALIDSKMKKILKEKIPSTIDGRDRLVAMRDKTLLDSVKPLIESRMKEVLKKVLPTVDDRDTLFDILYNSPESIRPLIESRISDCCNQKTIRFSGKNTLKYVVTGLVDCMNKGKVYISRETDKALYNYFNDLTTTDNTKS